MLQALTITLREGIEIALLLVIITAFLRKTGQESLSRFVYIGLASALAASLFGGLALSTLQFNHDIMEGILMLVAAAFVGSMTYWMWMQSRTLHKKIEGRMQALTASKATSAGYGLMLFVFLLVAREGLEMVLFLKAASLSSESAMMLLGGAVGLVLAASFGVALVKGTIRVDLRRFFSVTTAILLLIVVQLLVSGLHELSEANVLPSSKAEMAVIGPIVRNDVFFFVVVMALAMIMVIRSSRKGSRPESTIQSKAEVRKAAYQVLRETWWKRLVTASGFVIIACITAAFVYSSGSKAMVKPQLVSITGSEIQIPTASVADGAMHFFAIIEDGVEVRFFVIKGDKDGHWGTALDACEICGSSGYYQDGRNVICRNCVAPIAINSIGQSGGCNPIGLPSRVENGMLAIPAMRLTQSATIALFRTKSAS